MSTKKKLFLSAAGAAGGATTDVDDVFATNLWKGNAAQQIIENGIKLSNTHDGGSGNFRAGNTTRAEIATSSNFNFGTGDYTIEAWVFPLEHKNYSNIYDQRTASQGASTVSPIIYADSNGYVIFYLNGNNRISSSGNTLNLGAWNHVAVTRASGSTKLFLNGTQRGSTYSDSNTYVQPASNFSFGGSLEQNTYNFPGYVADLRVVKGTALYTSNFTPSTSYNSAVSGTVLLTAQGDTPFVDNSGNSVAITQVNGALASEFGPFTGDEGEGGLVWTKQRSGGTNEHHWLVDSGRTARFTLSTNLDSAQIDQSQTQGAATFNSAGYQIYNWFYQNDNNEDYVGWTFRKAPKFFDIVTWTGNGTENRQIAHNLGSAPGMILVKGYSLVEDWNIYHRSRGNAKYIQLNGTANEADATDTGPGSADLWFETDPTSTHFTIGDHNRVNKNGDTYVAYLFAHNNNDGNFGPDGNADIIKCGGYTGNNSATGPIINLGFEPQWVFIRHVDANGNSPLIFDNMRGVHTGSADMSLSPSANNDEQNSADSLEFNSTGFQLKRADGSVNGSSKNYIYVAIRRGPLAPPTDATKVFHVQAQSNGDTYSVGFPTDMMLHGKRNGSSANAYVGTRLLGGDKYLSTNADNAEASSSGLWTFDLGNEFDQGATVSNTHVNWHWKRAPGYFDVVAYTGTGSATTVNHNLGVVPEMIWVKPRETGLASSDWWVFNKDLSTPADDSLVLNSTGAPNTGNGALLWNSTMPTSSVFSLGTYNGINQSGRDFIAYLFATLDGVSKVGNYTGNGSAMTIDCGFSSGARFVLIKRTDTTDNWYVWDSARGIVAGNDPYLRLNTTQAEATSADYIDPHSSGFALPNDYFTVNGRTFIFYAIA